MSAIIPEKLLIEHYGVEACARYKKTSSIRWQNLCQQIALQGGYALQYGTHPVDGGPPIFDTDEPGA